MSCRNILRHVTPQRTTSPHTTTYYVRSYHNIIIITSRVRPPNGGRNEANSDTDTGYTNVVAVALAKTAANYFVILISM